MPYLDHFDCIKDGRYNNVAIICHDSPDPDCFASAMAVQSIVESLGLNANIYYGGEIGHTQNRVMVNVLNIPAIKIDDEEEDEETVQSIQGDIDNSYIVIVDTAYCGKENCKAVEGFLSEGRGPDLIIDHHDINSGAKCSYIHRFYGSCSSICYEIMQELGLRISKTLATALYLGINTDTADLKTESTTDNDTDAYNDLRSKIDLEKFLQILNYPKPLALVDLRRRAYANLEIGGNLAIASVGVITPQQRSLLAELCEELLEVESLNTAIVMAIVDEGTKRGKKLVASFRSNVLAINTKEFMSRIFGKRHAGGRKGAGAAQISLDATHSNTIDFIRRDHGDNGKLLQYVSMLFEAYSAKIREEKENV